MTKRDKLLLKFIQNPKNIKFHELQTFLSGLGFHQIKTNAGSHMKWHNREKNIHFCAPKRNPVKPVYIKDLINQLKQHFNL